MTGIPIGGGSGDPWLHDLCLPEGITDVPLVHVTDAGAAREIIRRRTIYVKQCRVFTKEKLVYFFALRPDFKKKSWENIDEQIDHFPAAFILSSESIGNPRRVMPFDSGAGHKGIFKRAFDTGASRYLKLEDYALLPSIGAVSTFIDRVFGDRAAYYRGMVTQELRRGAADLPQGVQSYVAIACLKGQGNNEPDLRSNAIEVAYSRSVDLDGSLKAVVLPDNFIQRSGQPNDEMRASLATLTNNKILYNWQAGFSPESYRQKIRFLVEDYLRGAGQI